MKDFCSTWDFLVGYSEAGVVTFSDRSPVKYAFHAEEMIDKESEKFRGTQSMTDLSLEAIEEFIKEGREMANAKKGVPNIILGFK